MPISTINDKTSVLEMSSKFFNEYSLKRNLQLISVFYTVTEFFSVFSIIYCAILIWLLFTRFYFVTLIYMSWMIYDRNAYKTGGHLRMWFRRLSVWKYSGEYFNLKLHKTAELDPNKNYIIGYHPHGITAISCCLNFTTEATNVSKLFPGITTRCLTLNAQYLFPVHRDIIAFAGLCGHSKECLEWIIGKNGTGNAAVITVGGAREALDATPYTMNITVKNKKGFVKMALQYGASLVPCVSFGDNEVYSHIKFDDNSIVRKIQLKLLNSLTFAFPIFYGRGFTENSFGFIPYRKQINTIVGKPIDVQKIEKPTQEDIDKLHELYVKAVCDLYYTHRSRFAEDPNVDIVLR